MLTTLFFAYLGFAAKRFQRRGKWTRPKVHKAA
jgi:hypothetical protein